MKILVTIKRVVDPYAKVRPLPDGSGMDTGGAQFAINPFDEIALEEAVRLKEQGLAREVVAVSLGAPEWEEQLRKALAMGADRAILVETAEAYDPLGVAKEIQAVAESEQPDLILMGKQATDDDANQVGQMLAARLGWPQATFASAIRLDSGTLRVTRETDTGTETLEMSLPAVVTADLRLNEPRYIGLPGIIKARSKPLERRPTSHAAEPKIRLLKLEAPPARAAGKRVADVDQLLHELRSKGVLA